MTTRVLPPDEWPRLAGTDLETVWPNLDPQQACVVVVEHEHQIVACVSVLRQIVLECLWVAPAYRAKATLAWRVLQRALQVGRGLGAKVVFTLPATDALLDQAVRLGGVRLPRVVVLPVGTTPRHATE